MLGIASNAPSLPGSDIGALGHAHVTSREAQMLPGSGEPLRLNCGELGDSGGGHRGGSLQAEVHKLKTGKI